jgi:hypothetical protein
MDELASIVGMVVVSFFLLSFFDFPIVLFWGFFDHLTFLPVFAAVFAVCL